MATIALINDSSATEVLATILPTAHQAFTQVLGRPLPDLTPGSAMDMATRIINGGWLFATPNTLGPCRFVGVLTQQETASFVVPEMHKALAAVTGESLPELTDKQALQIAATFAKKGIRPAIGLRPGQL